MRRLVPAIVAISAVAAGSAGSGAVPAARAAVPAAGSWGRAIEVPGLGALNTGGDAQVTSLSCASAGSCAAGGYYSYSQHGQQGFVAVERNGVWGKAIEVPGLGTLNTGGYAEVTSVSCAPAGSCAAGGFYQERSGNNQGFVAAERIGRWGEAIEVPGLAALNTGPNNGYGAQVSSVSCASAGNCAYGGYYQDRHDNQQGFVAAERNGRWGTAIEVPGLGALNKVVGYAEVTSVSCGPAGSCAAGGAYNDGRQGFVAVERNGAWGKAIEVPGLAALSKRGGGSVSSVSCAPAGSCAAGGTYLANGGGWQGFVAAERNGRWGTAIEVPGLGALNKGGFAEVNSVSCASPGNCAAGGLYSWHRGFVAAERRGRWGKAIQVPGLQALGDTEVTSVSCASAGRCAAGGYYADRANLLQPFVARQDNGRWGRAIQVPGLAALNKGSSQPFAQVTFYPTVSCAPAGTCAAGGAYTDASNHAQGFVTQAR